MRILIFLSLLLCLNTKSSKAQVFNGRSYSSTGYFSISYDSSNSKCIVGSKEGLWYSDGKLSKLIYKKPCYAYRIPNSNKILCLESGKEKSQISILNQNGGSIISKKTNYKIIDVCSNEDGSIIYALKHGTTHTNDSVLKFNNKFEQLEIWPTNNNGNGVNICYSKSRRQLLIGSGIKGLFMSLNGTIDSTYSTPHSSIIKEHGSSYSILNSYSDGAYISYHKEGQKRIKYTRRCDSIEKKIDMWAFNANYNTWDVSPNGNVIAIDQFDQLNYYKSDGTFIRKTAKSDHPFILFMDDKNYFLFNSKTKILEHFTWQE